MNKLNSLDWFGIIVFALVLIAVKALGL